MPKLEDLSPLESVRERDLDLLFMEEFHASPAFGAWFFDQCSPNRPDSTRVVGAWHSIADPDLGESDLVVLTLNAAGRREALLIENKIDAPPQPQQAERYRRRGEKGSDEGMWERFRTVLVAPERYLEASSDAGNYEHHIPYEQMEAWFRAHNADPRRSLYKADVIAAAIAQHRRGYRAQVDTHVTEFWVRYYEVVSQDWPELGMKPPGAKPTGSTWIPLPHSDLPVGRILVHKLERGQMDLQFNGFETKDLASLLDSGGLAAGASIVQTGRSASIRIHVPVVNAREPFESQRLKVEEGLDAAGVLVALSRSIDAGCAETARLPLQLGPENGVKP